MNYKNFKDIKLSSLGLGNMRLPAKEGDKTGQLIDYEKAFKIIDHAYGSGINYFDTAYVYNNGDSEKCLGECMKKHPRDSFYLATKFHIGANPDYKAVFEEQLKRLQTDYIDFYLIHCVMDGNVDQYLKSGAIEYFLEKQKEGKIKYLGFSSHAGTAALTKFADHHQWDFAQIQLNYYDWNYSTTAEEHKILTERNIPIMVMEPVRGGRLSNLTPDAEKLLKEAHPEWSISSWALRFVNSLPGIQVVLSGMSNLDQLNDNLATFSDSVKFTDADREVLFKACNLFKTQLLIPCTACRYCTDGCPMQINIPAYLKLYNDYKVDGPWALSDADKIESEGKPYDCIGCGACTGHCPQSIDTPTYMQELGKLLKK